MKKPPRKLMSNITPFMDSITMDCIENRNNIINEAKQLSPFGPVPWPESTWDITESVSHKIRGHETRKTKNLHFTQNVPNNQKPFEFIFSETIKALTSLRFYYGGQGADNQQRFIDGWRYIHDVSAPINFKIELITPEILNNACKQASLRLAESTAYNIHKSIHEIADLLDAHRLVKSHLGFRYAALKRPANTNGVENVRLDEIETSQTISNKMVNDAVLEAIGLLYRIIPRENIGDRVRILLVTLAIFLGRRIGEILTLPALPVRTNENSTPYLTYFPQKKSQGNLTILKERLPLPSVCLELIEIVIQELLTITEPYREVATYIHMHQHADYRILQKFEERGWMSSNDIEEIFLVKSGKSWADFRNLTSIPHPAHRNPRALAWTLDQIKSGMNTDIDLNPVITSGSEGNIYLKDCIAILPMNSCHAKKSTFNYSIKLLNWQHISDFLGNNEKRRELTGSAFDRYLAKDVATRLKTNSHAFRHTLNTWLDEGGMSDAAQTQWFARKYSRDTKAYQHTSPAKAALQVRRDLLDGKIFGPVADQLDFLPIDKHEAFIKARIRAVHDVGPGICFHDISQTPCERSLQCSANCDDYHWRSDDPGRIDDLKRQYAIAYLNRQKSKQLSEKGRGQSKDWFIHNNKKLHTLRNQLIQQGIEDFDVENYFKSMGGVNNE